jgi:MFS family permease
VAGMAVCGLAFLVVMATLNTTVQLQVAEAIRGRVLALWMVAITGAYPLGALLQGWLADQIGARATVTAAGVVLAGVVAVLVARPGLATALDGHAHRREKPISPVPDLEAIVT